VGRQRRMTWPISPHGRRCKLRSRSD
jgi:hypothetical protein